jgi:hypothetical protein
VAPNQQDFLSGCRINSALNTSIHHHPTSLASPRKEYDILTIPFRSLSGCAINPEAAGEMVIRSNQLPIKAPGQGARGATSRRIGGEDKPIEKRGWMIATRKPRYRKMRDQWSVIPVIRSRP